MTADKQPRISTLICGNEGSDCVAAYRQSLSCDKHRFPSAGLALPLLVVSSGQIQFATSNSSLWVPGGREDGYRLRNNLVLEARRKGEDGFWATSIEIAPDLAVLVLGRETWNGDNGLDPAMLLAGRTCAGPTPPEVITPARPQLDLDRFTRFGTFVES